MEPVYPFLHVFVIHLEKSISAACPWKPQEALCNSTYLNSFSGHWLFSSALELNASKSGSKAGSSTTTHVPQHTAISPLHCSPSGQQINSVQLRQQRPKGHPTRNYTNLHSFETATPWELKAVKWNTFFRWGIIRKLQNGLGAHGFCVPPPGLQRWLKALFYGQIFLKSIKFTQLETTMTAHYN